MGSVPTSLGEWIHSPWFDLGLVVWKGYRPRVRLVLAGGHASAWISPFWRGPAPGAQRYQALDEHRRALRALHQRATAQQAVNPVSFGLTNEWYDTITADKKHHLEHFTRGMT